MRVMKLTAILILVLTLHVSATGYSQNTRLSMNLRNSSVKDILRHIEEQSDYRFIYNNEAINLDRKVDLIIDNKKVEEVLDELFRDQGIRYSITEKNLILIKPLDGTASGHVAQQINMQQNLTIRGKVTDSNKEPLAGVAVIIKGTTTGTVTDAGGSYILTQIRKNSVLTFSFMGMEPQDVVVGDKSTINVEMVESAIGIEEVVAIGYGSLNKKELTSAISHIGSDDFLSVSSVDPSMMVHDDTGKDLRCVDYQYCCR